jgi:hypothetical protein
MPALPDRNDPLQTTLDSLRSDVERTPLADSLSVRRRGEARSRHQAVAGALVVAALVAGAFGVADLRGNERHGSIPAHVTPSPSTSLGNPMILKTQPLLEPAAFGSLGGYHGWQANPDPASADLRVHQCVPVPTRLGAQQAGSRMFYDQTTTAHIYEHVLRFAGADEAARSGAALLSALSACTRGGSGVVARNPEAVQVPDADSAARASRSAAPAGSEVSYYELAVVREGNVLVVLQWNSMGLGTGIDWVWTADLLGAALHTATAPAPGHG